MKNLVSGFTLLILAGCSSEEAKICSADTSQFRPDIEFEGKIHEYSLAYIDDLSIPGRNRVRLVITAPTAVTKLDRAATAIWVAKIYSTQYRDVPSIQVWLDNKRGDERLAVVSLYTDGCGNSGQDQTPVWNVIASDAAPGARSLEIILREVAYNNEHLSVAQ